MGRGLTVTLDPPRAGCSPEVLRGLMMLEPDRIVYISCDPGTLARDLAGLVKTGYRVEKVQPVDLFPQTSHIETAVKLIKQ
jgi:23S rRNA (uracil1939-C5)-methyltransferase